MDLTTLRSFLFWCTLMNFAVIAVWALLSLLPHGWLHRLWGRWFRMSAEQFDTVSFAGIMFYKILVLTFNLVPYIALVLVGLE
jgi:hypothetical protein